MAALGSGTEGAAPEYINTLICRKHSLVVSWTTSPNPCEFDGSPNQKDSRRYPKDDRTPAFNQHAEAGTEQRYACEPKRRE